ncbi:MAG: alpha/beta-type small acid-soluble spore protein [Actinobacteria bacterium]|nr:alpha/beta-type small acid-soluble spore protein [Actinomycetota bacterium]
MERFKMDVAEELGLADKVQKLGWGGLTAAESGRVGGYMTKKLKAGLVPPGLVEQVENALQFKR